MCADVHVYRCACRYLCLFAALPVGIHIDVLYVYRHVCMYVCMHVTCMPVCMYSGMPVDLYRYLHICIYASTSIWVHAYITGYVDADMPYACVHVC